MEAALADRDYFSDHSILRDPYAYFEAIRDKGPVYTDPNGIVIVTGYAEILDILKDTEHYSSALAPQGPAAPLPFTPEGSDITPQIEAHRLEFLGGDLLVSVDDMPHTQSRALLNRLFTPSRLKANEAFINSYSEELLSEMVAKGKCDLIKDIATPFVTMVIADLLGVPEGDRIFFMDAIDHGVPPGSLDAADLMEINRPLIIMAGYFIEYVNDRRASPREDILSELSNATFPDGTTPDAMEIVRLSTFLFGAGQDTSAKLLGNAMRFIIDQPGLQDELRADPSLIPALLEEVLRLEGSTKMTARLARKDTKIGDLDVPAGTKVMLALAAGNRDPRRWEDPQAFMLNRPKIKEHIAFGRGAHVCVGAPLARVEVRILLEKLLELTSKIDFNADKHGPPGARHIEYEPSFIIRGVAEMQLELTPAVGFVAPKVAAPEPESAPKGGLTSFFGFGKKKAAEPASEGRAYATATTKIGELLKDAEASAILEKHVPGMTTDSRIGMGKGMTLRTVQKFAPDQFSDAVLDAIDADLATLS